VKISLDGQSQGNFDLSNDASVHGQYYVKVFEALGLERSKHQLRIECDGDETLKTIDMLSISD
jgi:hypothetical protein